MRATSNAARKELHELVDTLPQKETLAARRYLEYLRDLSDPYAYLDHGDPFDDMPAEERARLHAALDQAEQEFAAGKGIPADMLLRELRASR
jgi:hypothetical protein